MWLLSNGFFGEKILLSSVVLRRMPYDSPFCGLYIVMLIFVHENAPRGIWWF